MLIFFFVWVNTVILQMIETATYLVWKLPSPWRELLVQCSLEDLQSRQDAGNFTVSQKRQNTVQSALYMIATYILVRYILLTGNCTCLGSCRLPLWASLARGGEGSHSEPVQYPSRWRSWSIPGWPFDAPLVFWWYVTNFNSIFLKIRLYFPVSFVATR